MFARVVLGVGKGVLFRAVLRCVTLYAFDKCVKSHVSCLHCD